MKKIIFILFTILFAFSCKDNEDHFDWFEDAERPTNVGSYQHTMTDADYTIIVNALKATGVEENTALANKLSSAKMFSPELDPAVLIPYFLNSKYVAADVKSSAIITYQYNDARDEVLSGLSGSGYTLVNDDYATVWGASPLVLSLTPAKSASSQIPAILKTRFPDAVAGDYKTVEYYYSDEEPVTTTVENIFLEETFEGYPTGSGVKVNIDGWINVDETGGDKIFWQSRSYTSGGVTNSYAQVSSYTSGAKNEVWLITPNIDLTASTTTPKFAFDMVTGNFTAAGLRIMISENFNGTETEISAADWADVTSSFTIPEPASGYSAWATAGTLDLTAYKGKKIYIGFKYLGDDTSTPKVTTTYQVDNVKVWEEVSGTDVEDKYIQYATYTYGSNVWTAVGTSILTLQPEDYTNLNLSSPIMTTAQAQTRLPQYMVLNGLGSTEKVVVYRTAAGVFYADRLVYENSIWTVESTITEESSQYVRADVSGSKVWIFDPTLIIPITKADYQLVVDYMKEHFYDGNENAWDTRGNAEFYFGFSAYYGNVSYREVDRSKDNTYPIDGTQDEKVKFMDDRTKEGLIALLTIKYPNATPLVSGVEQFARYDNVLIYSEPGVATNVYWTYTFQCTGDKEWKFISRESITDGRTETAE